MGDTHRIPQDDVLVFNGAVGCSPLRQAISTFIEIDVVVVEIFNFENLLKLIGVHVPGDF